MDIKWEHGDWALGPGGLPGRVSGLAELLQNAGMRIAMVKGSLPYEPELGSGFWQWDPAGDHALERAVALANEALLDLPGVRATAAQATEHGAVFTIATPLGEGDAEVWKATKTS